MQSMRRELNSIPTAIAPASMHTVVRQLTTFYNIESIRRELDTIAATFVSAPISMPIRLRHAAAIEKPTKETQKAQKGSSEKVIPPVSSKPTSLSVTKIAEESQLNEEASTSSPSPASPGSTPLRFVKTAGGDQINIAPSTEQNALTATSTAPKTTMPRSSIFDSKWADETSPSPTPQPKKAITKPRRRNSKAAKQQASPSPKAPAQPQKAISASKAFAVKPAPKEDTSIVTAAPRPTVTVAPKQTNKYSIFASAYAN